MEHGSHSPAKESDEWQVLVPPAMEVKAPVT